MNAHGKIWNADDGKYLIWTDVNVRGLPWQLIHIDRHSAPYKHQMHYVTRFVGEKITLYIGIIIAFLVLFYTFPIFSKRPKVLHYFLWKWWCRMWRYYYFWWIHTCYHIYGLSQCGIPFATTAHFISSIKPQSYPFYVLDKNIKFY